MKNIITKLKTISEWPLFFTYLILDAIFHNDSEAVEFYRSALKGCMVDPVQIPESNTQEYEETDVKGSEKVKKTPKLKGKPSPVFGQSQIVPTMPLIPEVYIVPLDLVDEEKKNPHSQKRIPNENVPLGKYFAFTMTNNL